MQSKKFSNLSLNKEMLRNLDEIGYTQMTPIQQESLPFMLEGRDVIAQAKTGSGKTAAFGIALLHKLQVKKFYVQSLVLCPTRELAEQVARELRLLARFAKNIKILTLCGGSAFAPQARSLHHGAHIVVGTPGRIVKHLKKENLMLEDLGTLVFDEADRMLDMGFSEEIDEILAFVPKKRETFLFSATYTDEIIKISASVQKDALDIQTTTVETPNKITEYFYESQKNQKFDTLLNILSHFKPQNALVFANTKIEAQKIEDFLQENDIDALAIHGDLEQYERVDVLVRFANKSCRVLAATDVAARGLDIKDLSMVINYDLPHSHEIYTHRIGRTARKGEEGVACTLYTFDEIEKIEPYQKEGCFFEDASKLQSVRDFKMKSQNRTLVIEGGKKEKVRAGDIVGALTGEAEISSDAIGKIDIFDRQSYVALKACRANEAYEKLKRGKIKAKSFPIWIL